MVKYLGVAGSGNPPETRVTFDTLEEFIAHQEHPSEAMTNLGIFQLDELRVIDEDSPEYGSTYVDEEADKRGNPRKVVRGGEYVGGRPLTKKEVAQLKQLKIDLKKAELKKLEEELN